MCHCHRDQQCDNSRPHRKQAYHVPPLDNNFKVVEEVYDVRISILAFRTPGMSIPG